ncbi:uncharacterized protein UTRI_10399_B [Ustilago trichophora]|uniref:Effector family protein Eff1 n=1 Tax=Ustilago trichophora TaxID=86804 RepID=A0A5C3E8X7_9BASI|nr:uncharacterized protein UTRI_10399_B [Ustilago trichophora]
MRSIRPFVLLVVLTTAFTFGMDEEPPRASDPEPERPEAPKPKRQTHILHGFVPEHEFLPVPWSNPSDGVQHGWGQAYNVPSSGSRLFPVLTELAPTSSSGSKANLEITSTSQPSTSALPADQAPQSALDRVAPSTSSSLFPTMDSQAVPGTPGQPNPYDHIPAFQQHPEGRIWGPYALGGELFHPVAYPLNIPAFEHLYDDDGVTFLDFENLYQRGQFRASGMRFRPEPSALEAIHEKIWASLKEHQKLEPGIVRGETNLLEGEYLWPPVYQTGVDGRLNMPSNTLLRKLRSAITYRLKTHSRETPRMYHIEATVKGNKRHFLMFPPKTWNFVNHWAEDEGPRPWVYLESYKQPASGSRDPLAFLGLTFLPHHADEHLLKNGIITPAFIQALRS